MDSGVQEKRKSNPRKRANIFSLLTFSYTFGLFKRGIVGKLQESDIYEVLGGCNSKTCGDRTEKVMKKTNSLIRLMVRRFGFTYGILATVHLSWTLTNSILQPYAMSRFISYFTPYQTDISRHDAYIYGSLVIFLSMFHSFYWSNYLMFENKLMIQIRASFTSVLYRKVLRMSPEKLSKTGLGNIVTILTKDVRIVEHNMWMIHDMIVNLLQTVTVSYLMYLRMGPAAFLGIGFMLLALPTQVYFGIIIKRMRLKIGRMSDFRIQVTQEVFSAIKIIKMYTWETFFNNKINEARRKEIFTTMKAFYVRMVIICVGLLSSKLTFPILIISYVWLGYSVNTELVFYLLSLFRDLGHALGIGIPLALGNTAEIYAALTRINIALSIEELQNKKENSCSFTEKLKINLNGVTVCMNNEEILSNISLNVDTVGLIAITGHIGSGKSSLIKTILKDYPVTQGNLYVSGSISYASQDPWLFPSSVKQNILFGSPYNKRRYEEVIRVCALEYDLNLFPKRDETVVSDRGMNLSKGQQCRINFARAIYKTSDIYLLDDSLAALDASVQQFIFKVCIKGYLKNKIVLFVTQNPNHLNEADKVVVMDNGKIVSITKPEDIFNEDEFKDRLLEEKNIQNESKLEEVKSNDESKESKYHRSVYHETKREGKVPMKIYIKYLKYGGGVLMFSAVILVYIAAQSTESYSQKLVSKWVDYQQTAFDLQFNTTVSKTVYDEAVANKNYSFNLFFILSLVASALSLIKAYSLLTFCRKASMRIHQAMAVCIIGSTMAFLDTHFLGNILNRFSYDLDNMDEGFPFMFLALLESGFSLGGDVILMATVHWIFLIAAVVFFVLLYLIRAIYLPTGRALKRLEAMTRSPMIGHLNATLEGLTTIRAYQAQEIVINEFDKHQDLYTSTYYMVTTTKRAFGIFTHVTGSLFVAAVVLVFLFGDTGTSVGDVGLAITQVMVLTNHVQWAIREWTEMENQMTSMERALEYTTIKQEDTTGGATENWPKNGEIRYEKVSLSYNSDAKILKDISFKVKPCQKVGIVGRTGAGKSSIILTLFRLYDIEGKIFIDNVDITNLSLNYLRMNIAIIPQDPIIFEGTVRSNIDPYEIYTDSDIWRALDKVKIKPLINDLGIQILKLNLSSGQKQLLSLARAIIRRNKIIVLDEATANVDAETDLLIQESVKENFAQCTVIMIAHRLNTIMSCDMVIVLENGEIVQHGEPLALLGQVNGAFYRLTQRSKQALT